MIYHVLFDIILFIRWSILFINLMKNTPSTIVQRPSAILQHRHSFEQSSSPHLRSFPSPSPPLQPISSVSFSGCLLSSCPVGCTPVSAQWCCPLAFWGACFVCSSFLLAVRLMICSWTVICSRSLLLVISGRWICRKFHKHHVDEDLKFVRHGSAHSLCFWDMELYLVDTVVENSECVSCREDLVIPGLFEDVEDMSDLSSSGFDVLMAMPWS